MKKAITASAILFAALIAYATMTGDLNTWLGYMAGEDATGERTTVQGAGAGGGASYLYRTELIGAASGVYGYWFQDSVGIGYRALRHSSYMTNVIAIGSHALEGVQGMGTMADVTWVGGHFVANPPNPDPTMVWSQVPGEFYITGDASKTNSLAPIWFDGSNLWLNAEKVRTRSGSISGGGYGAVIAGGGNWLLTKPDGSLTMLRQSADNKEGWSSADGNVYLEDEGYLSPGLGNNVTMWGLSVSDGENYDVFMETPADENATEITFTDQYSGSGVLTYTVFRNGGVAGKTFDLSTDAGLREAVSNIVITLGGTVVN